MKIHVEAVDNRNRMLEGLVDELKQKNIVLNKLVQEASKDIVDTECDVEKIEKALDNQGWKLLILKQENIRLTTAANDIINHCIDKLKNNLNEIEEDE